MTTYWPLFGLRITTERLVLRPPTDDDFPGLLAAIEAGIHDPAVMPFSMAWTDAPRAERERNSVQWWWRQRAEWKPNDWSLPLGVFLDDRAVGMQDVNGKQFSTLRVVETGSWLTREVQGRGLGKEMRVAALHLVFEGLGAEVAQSGAFTDNARSLGVSRSLGYVDNGVKREAPRGEVQEIQNVRITRETWLARRSSYPRVEISGLDGCREMFGV
ncbi:MAG TPA: GNAT family protein [Mycobacteriales bacterium]|nr:GNAT family protein [Mycobacteriales bacterium]